MTLLSPREGRRKEKIGEQMRGNADREERPGADMK